MRFSPLQRDEPDYLDAQRARGLLAARLLQVFEECDVLVMPTVPVVAPPAEDVASYRMVRARNANPWSLVGFPGLSVPCGFSEGLPVGLKLVAAPGREDLLGGRGPRGRGGGGVGLRPSRREADRTRRSAR